MNKLKLTKIEIQVLADRIRDIAYEQMEKLQEEFKADPINIAEATDTLRLLQQLPSWFIDMHSIDNQTVDSILESKMDRDYKYIKYNRVKGEREVISEIRLALMKDKSIDWIENSIRGLRTIAETKRRN